MRARIISVCSVVWLGLNATQAQLAVTEVMSSGSTNLGSNLILQNSDWWELTNFGTNTLDLTGYKWNDNAGGILAADPAPFNGLMIGPGASIVFFQSNAPASMSPEQFRQWWGSSLPATVQVVMYIDNGLSSAGDGLRLWGPDATTDADVIDSVDFGPALRGSTFVYNPMTGVFDTFSTNGVGGAFQAVMADDIGSPGTTTGPVPLVITQQPTNLSVNPGDTAAFTVVARGLPRPKYQWSFNGVEIPGARFSTLFVTNAQANNVGPYSVRLNNEAETLTSSNATLSLNAAPEAPRFTLSPANKNVFINQRPTFTAMASGVPEPTYQWRHNGTDIPGETGSSFTIFGAQTNDAGVYSVVARNPLGAVTNEATLIVTRRPRLVITEIMPAENTNGPFRGHNDWWELSNLDDFTVDLSGYRFDDGSAVLAAAVTFTNRFSIAPGESIVFVESMTVEQFRQWWGAANLKTNLQIIPYSGGGLSLSSLGDAINVWNSGAIEDFDTISSEVFSTATNGVSFRFDPEAGVSGDLSQEGLDGAFRAPENGDIGSPGYTHNPPEPRILKFDKAGLNYSLTWTAMTNRTYTLVFKTNLTDASWTPLQSVTATGPFATTSTPANSGSPQRFYRVALEP